MTAAPRYFARSASNNTDDWPFWYVADRQQGNLNVTAQLRPDLVDRDGGHFSRLPFLSREEAIAEAERANGPGAALSDG